MLSPAAQKITNEYFNLPFKGVSGVRCPYFNNRKWGRRGQLRVLAGKGTPGEIVGEAKIISIQYHHGIFEPSGKCCLCENPSETPTAEKIRRFLIDHRLGIDCSGFVTHILQKHFEETKNINLAQKLYKKPKNFWRKIVGYFRPVENIGVKTYANDLNTEKITDLNKAEAGDLIVMLETGPQNKYNHILLITENFARLDEPAASFASEARRARQGGVIKYAHARGWSSEGQYGHGVTEGIIKITNASAPLLSQVWEEKSKTGEENETFLEAKQAKILEIRRIRF